MAKIVFKRENGADNNAPPGSHKQRRRRRRRSTKSNSSLPLLGISNPTLAAYALPNPNQRKDSSNRSMAKLRKSMESRAKVRKRRSRIKPQLNKVDTEDRRHAFGPSVAERQVEDLLQVMYERMDIHRQRRRRKRRARRTLHVRKIQPIVRGHIARKFVQRMHASAAKFQAAARRHLVKRQYVRWRQRWIQVQSSWRRFKARQVANRLRQLNNLLQSFMVSAYLKGRVTHLKAHYARRIQQKKAAAPHMQRVFRGYRDRKTYAQVLQAVCLGQAHMRGFLGRKRVKGLMASGAWTQLVLRPFCIRFARQLLSIEPRI